MNLEALPRRIAAAIAPDFLASFANGLLALARSEDSDRPKLKAIADSVSNGSRLYDVVDGCAIIGVQGILVDKYPWVGSRWVTGYDALRCQLAQAFADVDVRGVVLDIDSGGGMVAGLFDLIDWAVAARAVAGKPMAAILSENAYSAAYGLASLADSIAVPRTGGVGSIGVVMLHLDWSKYLDTVGIKATFIQAGAHKTDGNPYEPLPDAVFKELQAETEDLRHLFATTVVRGRQAAGAAIDLAGVLKTEARCYSGPAELAGAMGMGLADAMLSPDQAFEQFRQAVAGI